MKIAFLGAGSLGFGRRLITDILSFPELTGGTIHLMDPNQERLDFIEAWAKRMVEDNQLTTCIQASAGRGPALDGADFVITSIRTGKSMEPEALDVQIPIDAAGLRQTVADTVGIGGLFKGLRTIPAMLEIARDMERRCPDALLLNYTNPMAMIQWAVGQATSINTVGLCHSVQGTSKQLANYIGVEYDRLSYRVAGINHMAWFTQLRCEDEDLYPRLKACLDDPEIVAKDRVRFEILRHFGYYVTESSTHMAEYVPFFMKSEDEISRLDIKQRTAETFKGQGDHKREELKKAWDGLPAAPTELKRSHEYAAEIILAVETDRPVCIHGNVRNTGLITNLPDGCCVEVPCLLDRAGLHPCFVGEIPPQCAALCLTNINMQGLTVKAILENDREAVYHAAMLDPNTHSQLTLPQIRQAVDQLLDAESEDIPSFGGLCR